MAYFKIGNTDFSHYVNSLKVKKSANYNSQTNAAGNTVVDYINKKLTIEVGIIPLTDTQMQSLQNAINDFNVSISYRDPNTNALVTNVNCIIPNDEVEYYTIQVNKTMYKACTLQFFEL